MVVRIDQEILTQYSNDQFNFSSLDSIDIAKLIKKERKKASYEHIYLVKNLPQVKDFLKIDC